MERHSALALTDRSSAATVMAGLTVAFLALYFLPLVDSIEAFGLKAKLREKVVEADKLVNGLRSTALVASRTMYAQLGWLGRMGAPSWIEKRQWYGDLESNLRALDVDAKAVRDLQRPFLDFVSFDLYALFESVVVERLRYHGRKLAGEIGELQAKQEKDEAAIIALTEKSGDTGAPRRALVPDLAT